MRPMDYYQRFGSMNRWYPLTDALQDAIFQPHVQRQAREMALVDLGYIGAARELADSSPRGLRRAREAYVRAMRALAVTYQPERTDYCEVCHMDPCRCGDEQEFGMPVVC